MYLAKQVPASLEIRVEYNRDVWVLGESGGDRKDIAVKIIKARRLLDLGKIDFLNNGINRLGERLADLLLRSGQGSAEASYAVQGQPIDIGPNLSQGARGNTSNAFVNRLNLPVCNRLGRIGVDDIRCRPLECQKPESRPRKDGRDGISVPADPNGLNHAPTRCAFRIQKIGHINGIWLPARNQEKSVCV